MYAICSSSKIKSKTATVNVNVNKKKSKKTDDYSLPVPYLKQVLVFLE